MTDVVRDFVVALAGATGTSLSPVEIAESEISSLTQVMQALCFDLWVEEPLRLADFVA